MNLIPIFSVSLRASVGVEVPQTNTGNIDTRPYGNCEKKYNAQGKKNEVNLCGGHTARISMFAYNPPVSRGGGDIKSL